VNPFKTESAARFAMDSHGGFGTRLKEFAVAKFRAGKLLWKDVDPRVEKSLEENHPEPAARTLHALLTIGLLRAKFLVDQDRVELNVKPEDRSVIERLTKADPEGDPP
jgi:hypothetical protein